MRKLNHLMTYESFNMNEEFNPLKKEDWKSAGTSIRKGVGFLTPEEEIEEGKKLVLSHPTRRKVYNSLLNDPKKANAYLRFWASAEDQNCNPVWDESRGKFIDKSHRYSPPGSIAAGN